MGKEREGVREEEKVHEDQDVICFGHQEQHVKHVKSLG